MNRHSLLHIFLYTIKRFAPRIAAWHLMSTEISVLAPKTCLVIMAASPTGETADTKSEVRFVFKSTTRIRKEDQNDSDETFSSVCECCCSVSMHAVCWTDSVCRR